jgi:thiamine-monophosphate kinase
MHCSDMGSEFELIRRITEKFTSNKFVIVGPGDDAAVLEVDGSKIAIATDVAVENVHFKSKWLTPIELGQRIVAQNLADIVAMSATPIAITASVAAPIHTEPTWFEALAVGMQAECDVVGASVVGGDLSTATEISISVTAIGVFSHEPVVRSGAAPQQIVGLAGTLGYSAAGLHCLQTGHSSPRKFVENFRVPKPPYQAGINAASHARSMIDISDGLISDAFHIASASNLQIHINSDAIKSSDEMSVLASAMSVDAREWILHGGEEHSLLATFDTARDLPSGFRPIGHTESGVPGVFVDGERIDPKGFTHF